MGGSLASEPASGQGEYPTLLTLGYSLQDTWECELGFFFNSDLFTLEVVKMPLGQDPIFQLSGDNLSTNAICLYARALSWHMNYILAANYELDG